MLTEKAWFIAELIMEITVVGDPRNVVHRNHVLISAGSSEEAYSKAVILGNRGETSYSNPAGQAVSIRFIGVADLDEILGPLEDGAEVLFRYAIDVSMQQLEELIPQKSQLRVFAPKRRSEGPDYASAQVVDLARSAGYERPS